MDRKTVYHQNSFSAASGGGIKFNERAEVMEVEQRGRATSGEESDTEDSSEDSSASGDESGISVTSDETETRI